MTGRLARRDRPASCRSVVLAGLLLLAACAQPAPESVARTSTASTETTPNETPVAASRSPIDETPAAAPTATETASAGDPGDWSSPVVVRHDDGSFSLVDEAGTRPIAMPRGEWWLGGSAMGGVLLLPVEPGSLDAAIVAVAPDGTSSLTRSLGDGSRLAGAGCVSPTGEVALASLDEAALELVGTDGARRPIDFGGHGALGECAWVAADALVTPAAHDHSLLYFHRTSAPEGHVQHTAPFPGVRGRYPAAGGGLLALTTGEADDEAVTLWGVGPIEGDPATPPTLETVGTFGPGDGPRRGVHAVSLDGRLLAVAGSDDGRPSLWLYDVRDPGHAAATVLLSRPADRIAFLTRASP